MACSWRGNPCLRLKWGCRMLLRNPCQSIDVNGSRSDIPQSGAKKDRIELRGHFRSARDLSGKRLTVMFAALLTTGSVASASGVRRHAASENIPNTLKEVYM